MFSTKLHIRYFQGNISMSFTRSRSIYLPWSLATVRRFRERSAKKTCKRSFKHSQPMTSKPLSREYLSLAFWENSPLPTISPSFICRGYRHFKTFFPVFFESPKDLVHFLVRQTIFTQSGPASFLPPIWTETDTLLHRGKNDFLVAFCLWASDTNVVDLFGVLNHKIAVFSLQ